LPPVGHDITTAPTASGIGVDDSNVSTLTPLGANYITAAMLLNNAIANSPFNNANWNFSFVNGTTIPFVPATDFTVNTYDAWVVTNDPVNDPGGTPRSRPVMNADGGGADWALTYTPRPGTTDPASNSIHVLQTYEER